MTNNQKYLIVIAGPTGVGKSSLAVDLAQTLETEIISTDSRQLYIEMDIGTAKPSGKELKLVHHHFINHIHVWQPYTVSQFENEALTVISNIFRTKNVVLACGGTGLYIEALCHGLDDIPDVSEEIRMRLEQTFKDEGIEALQSSLKTRDPEYFRKVDINNPRRLIRALGVSEQTGKPYSSFLKNDPRKRPFEIIRVLLNMDRKDLYEKIDDRVDQMLNDGLEGEVRALIEYKDLQALQTVGYQEWMPYFKNQIDRAEVIRLIKRNSRRYAKRQLTWFRKRGDWKTFDPEDHEIVKKYLSDQLNIT